MDKSRQVFQTTSRLRWNAFKWMSRLLLFFLLLMIPVVWIALRKEDSRFLPGLAKSDARILANPFLPKGFTRKEQRKYHGFLDFLRARTQSALLASVEKRKPPAQTMRAAFFVDWDPQSLYSLKNHIEKLNTVLPEWFFIDPVADTLKPNIDREAFDVMKKQGVRILPMLSNVNISGEGNFDPKLLEAVLLDKTRREQFMNAILAQIESNGLQGINIDFEELNDRLQAPVHAFVEELSKRLHAKGLLMTQDIMTEDDDYDLRRLAKANDYIFVMAYDQHYSESVPGPVSEQRWVEKELDEVADKVPPGKIILCVAGYGYDWPEKQAASTITYQQALSNAKEYGATIDFDNDTYNCKYTYTDYDHVKHSVFFMDAAGIFNSVRFADQYPTAGVALWRLGAEDERMWKFYGRDLSNKAVAKVPVDFSMFHSLDITTDEPDYVQEGEVLDVVSKPEKGVISTEIDSAEQIVSEEYYQHLPTRYVIKRFGNVHNQVLLTFDDGPDPDYTPRILDILKKENVPAAFFIVGVNGERHLPLLRRICREGYEIGNHSFTHPNMATVSLDRAAREMEATRLLIEAATGRSTVLFRAPYNADAEPTKAVELKPVARAKESNYYTVGESIDPEDWDTRHGTNADSIFNRVVRQYNFYRGVDSTQQKGIILLHDAGGNREATVQALPRIIHYFKQRNIQFISIGQLLKLSRDEIMPRVDNDLVTANSWVAFFVYWASRVLFSLFWVGIFLGLGKILLMGILAAINYRRSGKARIMPPSPTGLVSIIVPAYNEELNAVRTIQNLLLQDYPSFEIIFVDDGSSDDTYARVLNAVGHEPRVRVLTKSNGGKASALNFGIEHASGEYLVCIDADTQLMRDAISCLMRCFTEPEVVAVAGNVKVGNEKNILTKWQSIEYTTAQNFDRRAFDLVNGITVVPGAIGAFRKQAVIDAGAFTTDTLAEDCDLTIRLLRNGGKIRNCPEAVAVTEAPEKLRQFMKQRFRWSYGIMQSFWKNRDACFNPRFKALGMFALPNILIFQILMPIIAPLADLMFFLSLALSWNDPASRTKLLLFYALFLLVDLTVAVLAFIFEKESLKKLVWILPQRFVYRQLMYVVLFRSLKKAIKGEVQGWGVLKRTGNVVLRAPETITKT